MDFKWGSKTQKVTSWEAKTHMAPFWRENHLVETQKQKTSYKGELMTWRTKMQARVQGNVQLKSSICFKWVQISS